MSTSNGRGYRNPYNGFHNMGTLDPATGGYYAHVDQHAIPQPYLTPVTDPYWPSPIPQHTPMTNEVVFGSPTTSEEFELVVHRLV